MSALDDLFKEAEDTEKKDLQAAGLDDQYSLWRESMPNERVPNDVVLDAFLWGNDMESAAQDGRLSVSTGGAESVLGVDIPTPDPEGEETPSETPGDISKGDADGPDELKIVEGMWQPPKEAQAENYIEPTTKEIIKTPEWAGDAEIFYKFMGEPELPDYYENVSEWAKGQLSGFNWNLLVTFAISGKIMSSNDPKTALAFLNLMNMYDHSDGGWAEFGSGLVGMATDPSTYFGLAIGGLAAKGAAKAAAKTGLKRMIQGALVGGSAGIAEGGAIGGGFTLARQKIEKEAGAREEVNYGQVAIGTAIGSGAGLLLAGGGGALVGRYADKFAAATEKAMADSLGGKVRTIADLSEEQLLETLQAMQRAAGRAGVRDDAAEMALKILEGKDVPRNKNGSIDIDAVIEKIISTEIPEIKTADVVEFPGSKVPLTESQKLARRIIEMDELQAGGIVTKTVSRPGSIITTNQGKGRYELVGRTKNGWYRAIHKRTGEEINIRRKEFDVVEVSPKPEFAGPMSLDPFGETAAKVMAMAEDISSSKLKEVNITHREQLAIVDDLKKLGVDITQKKLATHWTAAEMLFLRNTYDAQANGIADMARILSSEMSLGSRLVDKDLARFNQAHAQFVATRDLFFGVSGNAARQLNILRSRPTGEVYQFSQSLLDSINMQGGRTNTERAIKLMAEFVRRGDVGESTTKNISKVSNTIWGTQWSAAVLNARYNMMLSSWRTHFYNFSGNSASGVYHHLMVTPFAGAINNLTYASRLAFTKIPGVPQKYLPDPAERFTTAIWGIELKAHLSSAMDSLTLAKEIAMGRDIGEGKVWNELGLRYNVINVPNSAFAKLGTTPVRLLEAGDAFFKNQYYNSKMHGSAARKARYEEIHAGEDFQKRFEWWLENPDATMEKEAREFAAKMTYTNDPNIYGGIFATLAKGMQTMQSKSLAFNALVPFVRTPANLLSFSMEMTGMNILTSPSTTYRAIMGNNPLERQEALARITVAVGLWYTIGELHKEGKITGAGPRNWEEVEAWKAAGWQQNSELVWGVWVDTSRADPAGRSINLIATVFDYMALNPLEQADSMMGWIGTGLLYTADNIIDESYLSTVTDFIAAIQSKETSRTRSISASTINSVLVPNLLRDIRRPTDEVIRSSASVNALDQVIKQMKNATPWVSDTIAPNRDWKGDPKHYYGNAYVRGLVPFNMRDPDDADPASMAIAYARIGPSMPDKRIAMPGGAGNFIDLFAMDNGDGFVYDKYVEFVGKARHEAVNIAMNDSRWQKLVDTNNIGPGSDGDTILREALAIGSQLGRTRMLEFLIDHHGKNSLFKRQNGDTVMIHHTFSVDQYAETLLAVRQENIPVPDELPQYDLRERREGPEFFKP